MIDLITNLLTVVGLACVFYSWRLERTRNAWIADAMKYLAQQPGGHLGDMKTAQRSHKRLVLIYWLSGYAVAILAGILKDAFKP